MLYGILIDQGEPGWLRRAVMRSFFYGAIIAVIVPVQFLYGTSGPGFDAIGFGPHMASDLWALSAKLVMPLKDGVQFGSIPVAAWAAGAVAGFLAIVGLIFGSPRLRFLIIWTLLALSPFTIWRTPIAPARYVFMAAAPFAILASWSFVATGTWIIESSFWQRWLRPRHALSFGAAALVLVGCGLLTGVFTSMTVDRNNAFGRESEPYRVLAEDMPKAVPVLPRGGRVVIYYGVWTGLPSGPKPFSAPFTTTRPGRGKRPPRPGRDRRAPPRLPGHDRLLHRQRLHRLGSPARGPRPVDRRLYYA